MGDEIIETLKKAFRIFCVYVGTVLGAGFVSGKELFCFFGKYGMLYGGIGLFLAALLFGIVGASVFYGMKMNKLTKYLSVLFLMVLFSAMIAGGGEALAKLPYINAFVGRGIMAGICFCAFMFGTDGVIKVNVVLCPFLIIGTIYVGARLILNGEAENLNTGVWYITLTDNFIVSAFLYVSYNIITAVPVLESLKTEDKKSGSLGSFAAGFAICALGGFMILALLYVGGDILYTSIPIMEAAAKYGGMVKLLYFCVFLASVITTAVGNGFAVINQVYEDRGEDGFFVKFLVTSLGFLASLISFSDFVEGVYPVFGYLGFLELICVIWFFIKKESNKD